MIGLFLADTLQETGHRSRGDQEDNGVHLVFIDSGRRLFR